MHTRPDAPKTEFLLQQEPGFQARMKVLGAEWNCTEVRPLLFPCSWSLPIPTTFLYPCNRKWGIMLKNLRPDF